MENLKQKISFLFYEVIEFISGTYLFEKLELIESYESKSRKEIQKYQLKALRNLLRTAYNYVPFYREAYKEAKVSPRDLKKLSDLSKFPVVTKELIRNRYKEMINDNYNINKLKCTYSSGSTGEPKIFYYDNETYGWRLASKYCGWKRAGFKFGEKWLRISMAERNTLFYKIFNFFSRCMYFSLTDFDKDKCERIRQRIEKERPKMIYSYSSSLYVLADYLNKQGKSYDFVESIIVQGDMVFPKYREVIEKVFNTKCIDTYGGDGIVISGQCKEGNYHIQDLGVIVEFVDEKFKKVPDGEMGRILVTDLHNKVMPLIRYEIADLGIKKKGECKCGSSFSMMSQLLGRDTDVIRLSNGVSLIVHHFTYVMEYFPQILQFQVKEIEKDKLLIYLKVTEDFKREIEDEVATKLKYFHKGGAKVTFKIVKDIPLERSNKRRLVISRGYNI
jgi:phenylacetate-CoA ligase